MEDEPLAYLLHRFATDATTLRARADHLGAKTPEHGPDAAASRRMADACDDVLQRLNALATLSDDALLSALAALGPALESRASGASDAYVRSVYGGAAARVDDVVSRTRAAQTADDLPDDADELDDDLGDDDDLDDDDVDDDDLDERGDGDVDHG